MLPDSLRWVQEIPYVFLLLIFAVVFGYISARVVPSKFVRWVRSKLKISRTPNENIWDDIIKDDPWARVWRKDSACSYMGQIKYIENYAREPIIVLHRYQYLDEDGEPLIDHSDEPERSVMLNLSGFGRIELIEDSKEDTSEQKQISWFKKALNWFLHGS